MKNRDISIKFVHREDHNKQTLSNERPKERSTDDKVHSEKDKKTGNINITKEPTTNHTDYFSSKIKKGVFDLKRFSNTERDIHIL